MASAPNSQVGKPNQQLRHAALEAQFAPSAPEENRIAYAAQCGRLVRAAFAGRPPLVAVETTFSLLRGTASPKHWAQALSALFATRPGTPRDRRGSNRRPSSQEGTTSVLLAQAVLESLRRADVPGIVITPAISPPSPAIARAATDSTEEGIDRPWALLADRDDLLGLPAAIEAWGRDHIGVGATVVLGESEGTDAIAVLAAPQEPGYAALCRLLSWRLEDSDAWQRWRHGDDRRLPLRLDGVVALVRDAHLGERLRARGAEVYWRAGVRPEQHRVPFPIVAAPFLSHIGQTDRDAAPVLEAIRTHGSVRRSPGGVALVDLLAMPAAYAGYEEQLEAGIALAQRLQYVPGADPTALHLPARPPGEDSDALLRARSLEGLTWRYGQTPSQAARERLEHELRVIRDKRFAGYVLTVHELCHGRRTCGRGSAASSIVVYVLGITNVDPIASRLLFERFLAPERIDPPDIDVDFPWDERDDVIQAALDRFGREHVAMVTTHQCMHRWSALREVAKAYGQSDGQISAIKQRLHEAMLYGGQPDLEEPWPGIVAAADAISGVPRHCGVHCGGLVIADRPLRELVPVHPAKKEIEGIPVPTIAWEKDGAELLGFVKVDFLSNRNGLAVVRDCLADLVEDGITIDERRWDPVHDPATVRSVALGQTMGCFYIESPAMRQLQAKVRSGDFDRLVVHSSIIRPAAASYIGVYIDRYHAWKANGERVPEDQRAVWYPHPALEMLISESFGVLSYQEDVMLVSQELAGFGSAEANKLRKALGRSDTAQRLQALAADFVRGCQARGVSDPVIDEVWGMISSFAGYSFTKAHSASYALVSFQCAWFRAHYPAYFMSRVLANDGGYYNRAAYVEEAKRMGVEVRPPCVAVSVWKTQREGPGAMRCGLQLLKGLSRSAADAIIGERAVRPFAGVRDLSYRCRLKADDLAILCEAGALTRLTPAMNHAQRRWICGIAHRDPRRRPPDGQLDLGFVTEETLRDYCPLDLADIPITDRRWRQHAVLGFLPAEHVLALWTLPRRRWHCADVCAQNDKRRVEIIGVNITRKDVVATHLNDAQGQRLSSPRHEPMAFVTIEDEGGLAETVWFPEAFARYGRLLERFAPLRLIGRVMVEHGSATLHVQAADLIGDDPRIDGLAQEASAD